MTKDPVCGMQVDENKAPPPVLSRQKYSSAAGLQDNSIDLNATRRANQRQEQRKHGNLADSQQVVPGRLTWSPSKMPYQPIEDYGVVGNLRTTALVGKNGSIDWFCFPHFDSPSVFGAILDEHKGGYFRIAPIVDGNRPKASLLARHECACYTLSFHRWRGRNHRLHAASAESKDAPPAHGLIRRVKVARGCHAIPAGMRPGV